MPLIGKVVKAHGIRGDLKVKIFMDSPDCFVKIKKISINNKAYSVEKAKVDKGYVLLKITGVDDMTTAETFRDAEIFCERRELPKPKDNRYYIDDIMGCTFYADDDQIGKIVDILQYGSADVLVIRGEKKVMVPWLKSLCAEINIGEKMFRVKKEKFLEVVTDED